MMLGSSGYGYILPTMYIAVGIRSNTPHILRRMPSLTTIVSPSTQGSDGHLKAKACKCPCKRERHAPS